MGNPGWIAINAMISFIIFFVCKATNNAYCCYLWQMGFLKAS